MKAILACEKHGGIGLNGSMPWPKQAKDLARFKELTSGTAILMGRGTWESSGMPKPLPNRLNMVATTQNIEVPDGVLTIHDLSPENFKRVQVDWVIGGAGLVHSIWDQIDEIHLSHLRDEYECDKHLDLARLEKDFCCVRSQLCLSHTYEIWKRKE